MAKGRGGGKTPIKVVELLEAAVAESSIRAVARQLTLTQSAIYRYLQGIGEPSQATLQKLADYFGVTVAYLWGEVAYNQASRREEVKRGFEAIHRIVRRGNLTHEDTPDIDLVSDVLAALAQDAFQLENVLQQEESTRESVVNKRIAKEWKEFSKEIDSLADQYTTEDSDIKKE